MALAVFLFLNISLKATINPARTNAIFAILSNPFAVDPHVQLGRLLRQEERTGAATQELMIAADMSKQGSNVLGATTDPASILEQWQTEAERLAKAYRFWRSVAEDKPDYRDAQLLAAALAFQQSDMTEAARFAQNTLALDPNNHEAQQLLDQLGPDN